MSTNDFLKTQNLQLLWEVLTDDEQIKNTTPIIKGELMNAFKINVSPFYKSEHNNAQNLLELNKKFIGNMLSHYKKYHINQNNQNNQHNQQFFQQKQYSSVPIQQTQYASKINIHENEPIKKELITFEDLQTHRLTEFETKYAEKEMDFKNTMELKIPPKPEFSDKIDEPISEIEVEMKKLIAQRNYDINIVNTQNSENAKNWLQPKETSIKKEHILQTQPVNLTTNIYEEHPKQVSWKNEIHEIIIDDIHDNITNLDINNTNSTNTTNQDISIFSKLKQVKNLEQPQKLEHHENSQQQEINILKTELNNIKNEIRNEIRNEISSINAKLDIIIGNMNKFIQQAV